MGLVVVVLLVSLGVGMLCGGRLPDLGALVLRSRWLVAAALVVQLAGGVVGVVGVVGGVAYPIGLTVSFGLVVLFLARNRGLPGSGLIGIGLLANALVVGANGAMPVSLEAAARAGLNAADLHLLTDPRHEVETPGTRLSGLGDVVPVPLPLRPEVVSPGDVAVAAGLGQVVLLTLLPRRRRQPVTGR